MIRTPGRLDRYIASEFLLSFLVRFLFYFMVFFLNQLLLMAQGILSKGIPVGSVLLLMLYSLPSFITLSAPFATLTAASLRPPKEKSYIEARLRTQSGRQAYLDLPLSRFYLPEDIAPQAERAYQTHSRQGQRDAFVAVRVRRGVAVIEDLYVGGKPLRDYLK